MRLLASLIFFTIILSTTASAQAKTMIVSFESEIDRSEQKSLIKNNEASLDQWLRGNSAVVEIDAEGRRQFAQSDKVRYIEPDYKVESLALASDDSQLKDLWGMKRIDAPTAWARMSFGQEVVVAISDTGLQAEHEDLKERLWINPGEVAGDSVDNDNNGIIDDVHGADFSKSPATGETADGMGHGTHVAGTVGGDADNNLGIAGVGPNVRLMNARFLADSGYGNISDGILSIDYAINKGAKVINCSWGSSAQSEALEAAIKRARLAGVLIVAAAGNNGQNSDVNPFYPAASPSTNVVAVAATTAEDQLAYFSNYSDKIIDVAGPGLMIRSSIVNGGSGYMSGTSMAAPHVAGAAAALWGEYPSANYWQIRQAIVKGGTILPTLSGKTEAGTLLNLNGALSYMQAGNNDPIPPDTVPITPTDPAKPTNPQPPTDPKPPDNPAPQLPQLTGPVNISGSRNAPGIMTCDGGSWSGANGRNITWNDGTTTIAYGATFQANHGDIGKIIFCRVIAFNSNGTTTVNSETVEIGQEHPFYSVNKIKPTIKAKSGRRLICDAGQWDEAESIQYKWIVSTKTISSKSSFRASRKYISRKAYCLVTAISFWGKRTTARSTAQKIIR